ncbi:hypothetical protein UFOVP609_34 [uncultured Caudovirales phage]|uniref:Uncharacterized protein n=1 Tax=uncultured Caudovirales phage TaxID=2100421 RepID=A0A6J5N6Z5_9CAUD|nr:hypothetical protein UFOVP609_34 [uncultured Caudovirales phage]
MALNIEFEGYVNEIKQFDWGTVVQMSHAQRAKNQTTGEWETVGKDYIDVTVPTGMSVPAQNSVAVIIGSLKVGTYAKKDGSTGVSLKVRAKDIRPGSRGKSAPAESEIW